MAGAKPRPDRSRWPIRTAVAADIPKRNEAARTVMPPANASATPWRKSRERGRAIIAGLLTSNDLESQSQQKGNPQAIQLKADRLEQAVEKETGLEAFAVIHSLYRFLE
ncbi:hypothetical protein U8C40_23800 (plasmid) [Sinorhizobium medicae]|nr:hypothetical protein [Sinorhizobium medicae]WQO48309.1 hypothetical protein U8C42_24610 [Sinorhizobium medicae]WQO68727.1 hypothetical protein U8C40_23800 [Sinorhizobium medicae]WQO75765.1 hypothetical protein U8C31_23545 [Sinorhizobium medicae]